MACEAIETITNSPAKGMARPRTTTLRVGSPERRDGRTLRAMPAVTTAAPSMMVLTGVQRLTILVISIWKQTIMIGLARV